MSFSKCTIHNGTNHVLHIKSPYNIKSGLGAINVGTKFILEIDPNSTYCHYYIFQPHNINASVPCLCISATDLEQWEEISIYTTQGDIDEWVGTKLRGPRISLQERDDYKAVKNETSARMKRILSRSNKLELHLKNIKICHAQSKHLVQTFSEGIQEMAENYKKVFQVEGNIRRLYNSKKLRILVNFVDSLENCVRDTEKFLLECKREWKLLALQVSVPLRSPATTTRSKFDLLIGELRWNLDKIRYTLCLGEELSRLEWEWCTIRCRHVLIEAGHGGVDHEGHDIGDSSLVYRDSDRDDLSDHLDDRSIFAQDQFLTIFKPWKWFAQNGSGEAFGEILKKRLCTKRCISPTSKSGSIPVKDFRISHLDLKCNSEELSRGAFKSIYRGEWFGQEVAIAIMVQADSLESLVERGRVFGGAATSKYCGFLYVFVYT